MLHGSRHLLFACLALHLALGCGAEEAHAGRIELSILAASSLTEAFQELAQTFEQAHPEIDVSLVFAGSQVLRLQIEQGAGVDLYASANEAHMRSLQSIGLVSDSHTFAHNELVVIAPKSHTHFRRFADLAHARRVVLGTDRVPIGIYARQVLERSERKLGPAFASQVRRHIVSEEGNVRLVRAKIELGEADAAIVYRTDATATAKVRMVPIPAELNVRANYAIGLASSSAQADAARAFIAFALAHAGQQTLRRHGFVTDGP